MGSEGIYGSATQQVHTAPPLLQSEQMLSAASSYAKSCVKQGPLLMNQAAAGKRAESAEPSLMLCRNHGCHEIGHVHKVWPSAKS